MNFMYSCQFTALVPQGNGTIQADFLVESSHLSNSTGFLKFSFKNKIYTRAGKSKKDKKKEDKPYEVRYYQSQELFCF